MFTYNNGRIVIHRITNKNKIEFISKEEIRKNDSYNEQLIRLPQNDTGNAKRFLLFCRDFVKYNATQGIWLIWDGKYWRSEDAFSEIMILAQAVMDKYYHVIKDSTNLDESVKKTMLYHAKSSNNYFNLQNMLTLVMHMNYVKEMKSAPYLLNTQNCVVDLRTKEKFEHHPKYGCTSICVCDYIPDVKSTRFKTFVKEITDYDKDLYDYLKTLSGYCSTGLRREEKFFVLWGKVGCNGKSKFLESLEYTLGGYAKTFPNDALIKASSDASRPTPELIPLINTRYAHASELQQNNIINDACIKQYTGNSHLLVRKMRQEYTKIEIFFKMLIDTNYTPKFRHFDEAIKRRLVIIPFNKSFLNEGRDLDLEKKLHADAPYILKFIVDGAYNYFKYGLNEPEIVRTTTEEYCMQADSVQSFIDNATEFDKEKLIQSSVLYQAYVEYCQLSSYVALDIKSFSQSLTQKGYEKKQKNKGAFFKDIKLI